MNQNFRTFTNPIIHYLLLLMNNCTSSVFLFKLDKIKRFYSVWIVLVLMLLFSTKSLAQLTSCSNCSASDIKVQRIFLADASGQPLSNTCTPGNSVSAQVCVEFSVTANTRYGLYFSFSYTVGSTTYSQTHCYPQEFSGTFKLCYPITYNCGESVRLNSGLLAWGNNRNDLNTICNQSNWNCNYFTPKCFSSTSFPAVEAPLIANFSSNATCQTGQTAQTVVFSGTATGGTSPYTYAWDLDGNGSYETSGQNPSFTYPAAGTYNVSLRVTDSQGATDVQTSSVTVASCPMPVLYTYFQAQSVKEGIQLEWQTSTEVNHKHFEVERSKNAIDFERIGTNIIAPISIENTRKTYRYVDNGFTEGKVYYRLKQVDISGKANYSKIISVVVGDVTPTVEISPNPFNEQLVIRILSAQTGIVQVDLIDLTGKRWSSASSQKNEQLHQQTLSTLKIPSGQYVISIRLGDQYFIRKVIK